MRTDAPALTVHAGPDTLPEGGLALLARAEEEDFAFGPAWWRTVLAHGMVPGAEPRFLFLTLAGEPAAIIPMERAADGGLRALTTPYTCLYAPILSPDLDEHGRLAVFRAFGRYCRAWATVRLDAMAADWPALPALHAGLREAGLAAIPFDHFGNWHERVAGLSWAQYQERRPGVLRETIRRKLRRAERDPAARFSIVTGGDELEPAIAAFEAIYARSWKEPEPFPTFNAGLMRAAAAAGKLRLGLFWIDDVPVATQLWLVEGKRATVLKLAHDEERKAASPGTVLSAIMLRRLLDEEQVEEIDYGRGDDPYKRLWTKDRRPRIGLVIANPLRPAGLAAIARPIARRAVRALRGGRSEQPDAAPDQQVP
jgi:CelD/BcsL family acetyltransferase involved in cellulose biosynthesis